MFNFGSGFKSELAVVALLGLGLYSQSHELNLANNTTTLLILFLLFLQQEEMESLKREHCEDEFEERRFARSSSRSHERYFC